jgi:hypothetical protein
MSQKQDLPWWAEKSWWKEPEYASFVNAQAAEFHIALETMQRHFDRAWWAKVSKSDRRNHVMARLLGKGIWVLEFIHNLGNAIALLENLDGFSSKMTDLKNDPSGAIIFEFLIAGCLRTGGLGVQFPATTNERRTPDILADCQGKSIAIECKKLEVEQWEYWATHLAGNVLNSIPVDVTKTYAIQIELDPRLSEIRTDEETYRGFNDAIAEAITHRIQAVTMQVMAQKPSLPYEFAIPGLGKATLLHNEKDKSPASLSGFSISPVWQLRRIITNGLWRAMGQLPSDFPGIVVIQCEHLPDPDFARLVLDAVTKKDLCHFGRLAAMVLVPIQHLNDQRPTLLFINHNSTTTVPDQALVVIRDQLKPMTI